MAHPTHILRTTLCGKRDPVHRLIQPMCQDKLEPKRRSACASARARIVEPARKNAPVDRVVELDASPLLVILHYLLKNNTTFMESNEQGKLSPGHPSVNTISSGGQRV